MKTALLVATATFALASGGAMAEGCVYGHSAKMAQNAANSKERVPAKSEVTDPKLLAMLKEKEADSAPAAVVHN